jgi:hypothetical protein
MASDSYLESTMSHWDFGRPPAGRHDAPGPAGQGDAADPDNARTPDDPWPPRGDRASDDPWSAGFTWTQDDSQAADDGRAGNDGSRADGGWPADDPWPADNGWTRDDPWPQDGGPADGGLAGDGPADGGLAGLDLADEEEGDGTAPYPITYERDPFTAAGAGPTARTALDDDYEPWPPAPYPGEEREFKDTALPPDDAALEGHRERADDDFADGRPGGVPWRDDGWPGRRGPGIAGHAWPGQVPGTPGDVPGAPGDDWGYEGNGGRRLGARRWLIPAGVVVAGAAVGVAAVLLTSGRAGGQAGQGAGRPAAAPAATPTRAASGTASAAGPAGTGPAGTGAAGLPLTIAEAQRVLAGYTTVNNEANAQRSDALLATIEAGSSYAIDAGLYQMQRAAGAQPFPPFSPVQATYYIPRGEPAAGPRWFVVQVANAFTSNPAKVTSAEYLLFTQSAPSGTWQDTIEPYLLPGASAPEVAVGTDGLATAVSPDAAVVTVAPGQLPQATATALDSTGPDSTGLAGSGDGRAAVAVPGNLADRADQRTWQAAVQGGQVSDAHAPAAGADGQEFALQTADGGALVFYTDAAEVTITPPAGSQLQLTIPGFYSPGQALAQARVSYLEQFAAYDPPAAAGGAPRVVADYSAITGAS